MYFVRALLELRGSGLERVLVLRALLGWRLLQVVLLAIFSLEHLVKHIGTWLHTLDTMHTMKPFSSILYDATVLPSCRILPGYLHEHVGLDQGQWIETYQSKSAFAEAVPSQRPSRRKS